MEIPYFSVGYACESSKALVTVLAAKDRVLAHNPLGALYLSESFYKKIHTTLPQTEEK